MVGNWLLSRDNLIQTPLIRSYSSQKIEEEGEESSELNADLQLRRKYMLPLLVLPIIHQMNLRVVQTNPHN